MKNHLLIGLSLLTTVQVAFAQPLKLFDDKTAFKYTFKTKAGKSIELTEKSIIEKKYEIKIRPSTEINKLVKDDKFEVIFTNGKEDEEIVYETKQSIGNYKSNGTEVKAITYYSEQKENTQIQCYEKTLPVENTEPKETKQKTECLKNEGCKSYVVKDNGFELAATPICIGSKESTVVTQKSNLLVTCVLWEGSDPNKGQRVEQLMETKEISEIKSSSDKCN